MTSTLAKPQNIVRTWVILDAKDQILGKLAVRIATVLRGKHKPIYTPYIDTGDGVVVINIEKLALTGRKLQQKTYQNYSGYPGGLKTTKIEVVMAKNPDRVLRTAVKGMMPGGPLARQMMRKLKIYKGSVHPHTAQTPVVDASQAGEKKA
jgi:large subunit ribosomal protein L13